MVFGGCHELEELEGEFCLWYSDVEISEGFCFLAEIMIIQKVSLLMLFLTLLGT